MLGWKVGDRAEGTGIVNLRKNISRRPIKSVSFQYGFPVVIEHGEDWYSNKSKFESAKALFLSFALLPGYSFLEEIIERARDTREILEKPTIEISEP